VERLGVDIECLSGNLIGPAAVVSNAASDSTNVPLSHFDGLAIVQGFNSS